MKDGHDGMARRKLVVEEFLIVRERNRRSSPLLLPVFLSLALPSWTPAWADGVPRLVCLQIDGRF